MMLHHGGMYLSEQSPQLLLKFTVLNLLCCYKQQNYVLQTLHPTKRTRTTQSPLKVFIVIP